MGASLGTRAALLLALRWGPAYGQELIRRVAAKTGGRLRLSEGNVYPVLKALEGEGLVRNWTVVPGRSRGGRARTYCELTVRGVEASEHQRSVLGDLIGRATAPSPSPEEAHRMKDRLLRALAVSELATDLEAQGRRRTREAT